MYHTLANQTTKDLVESNASLKQLAREVCHKFNVQIMTHDPELIDSARRSPYSDSERQARHERERTRLLLTKENGIPFCTINTNQGEDRSGNSANNYVVTSPMVHKEKGRGLDRMTRESIKIKSLMKTLEKDYDDKSGLLSLEYLFNNRIDLFRQVKQGADNIAKLGYTERLLFDSKTCESLLKQMFEGQVLNDSVVDYMKRKYEEHLSNQRKFEIANEISNRFLTECYLVLRYQFCPTVVAKVTLEKHIIGNDFKVKVKVHDEVKCYSSMNELSTDNTELAISLKMFMTRNETEVNKRTSPTEEFFPIAHELPWRMDKLDVDLDVLAYSNNYTGLGQFSHFQTFLVPVIKND